jgi:periplasmic protein CpxP/Spy
MTDHQSANSPHPAPPHSAPANPANAGAQPAKPGRLRRYLLVAALVLVAGLGGAVASQAFSGGAGFGPGMWHGRGFMGGPWGGRMDPARVEQRADRMVRHFAVEIDATAEQQEKLRTLVRATLRDLLPMREKAFDGRERMRALLTQATVDRAAIEAFRAEKLALADRVSKRIAQALGDAAEILTPEQRRIVGEHLAARSRFGRGWRHDRMMP